MSVIVVRDPARQVYTPVQACRCGQECYFSLSNGRRVRFEVAADGTPTRTVHAPKCRYVRESKTKSIA